MIPGEPDTKNPVFAAMADPASPQSMYNVSTPPVRPERSEVEECANFTPLICGRMSSDLPEPSEL
jgi:hypothetical protein